MRHDGFVSAPTIVLLHGQPDSSASFWALRRALRNRVDDDVRIVAPDRPGYGANQLTATDYQGNVDWLRRWLDRFCPGPVILLGHSWAGGLAALTAAQVPERIDGLVLLASIGPESLVPIDPILAAPVVGEVLAFATLRLGRGPIVARATNVIGNNLAPDDIPYAKASGAAMRYRPLWRSFLVEQRALMRDLPAITDALPRIVSPTIIISGTADQVIPPRTATALHAAIAQSRLMRVAGGHDLQLRQPETVGELVGTFAATLLADR